jgi:hypothetical protein
MAGILAFDANQLDLLLNEAGVETTWLRILAARVSTRPECRYILSDPKFDEISPLEFDLLEGLSIGEISVLYEYSVAKADAGDRKLNGQFFTPDDVANFMASFASDFGPGVWLDPCSGVGNLTWHLAGRQDDPEEFLLHRMVVADRDRVALFIARVLLTLGFQNHEPDLFNRLSPRFIEFDFLSVADNGRPDLWSSASPLEAIPSHDFVIMNPPYLSTGKDSRFETSDAGDLYAYFMENTFKTSAGFVSITPQSFTNAGKFRSLRALLLRHFSAVSIYAFDNVPANIFRGVKFGSTNSNTANSTRAAITVASNMSKSTRITGLTRWRSAERHRLFSEIEGYLAEVDFTEEFFPKVQSSHLSLYNAVKELPQLRSITAAKNGAFSLHIPSSPRYFIPALRTPVRRSSQRQIFLASQEEADRAYLLINSSLMYWWWRVRDGGMTLSLETLLSLPVPDFRVDQLLIQELEASEKVNKVYKQNGGAAQENVKHPLELVVRINHLVLPGYSELLLATHGNSELAKR